MPPRTSPAGAGAPVTVAVVSWNTRDLLERCLASLAADAAAGRAAVWVVDNASGDGSAEMVRERFPWASLVASSENLGFGPAVNLVAERAPGTWVAPANADVELRPGALEKLLATGAAHPRAGVIAPRLVQPDGLTQHSVHCFPTVALSAAFHIGVDRLSRRLGDRLCFEGSWDPERPREVDWAHGAFLLVRREAFEAVGRFDPAQWMYAEDLDLAWRLRKAGWTTRYEPAAVVLHAGSAATIQAFAEGRAARYMAATYAWMARRRGMAVARAFAAVNLAGAATRAVALTPLAALAPARWLRARNQARRHARLHLRGFRRREALVRHR